MNLVTIPNKPSNLKEMDSCLKLTAYEIIHPSLQSETLSRTNLYLASPLTLNPNQRSSFFEVTLVIVPFGSTSSNLAMLSTASPY